MARPDCRGLLSRRNFLRLGLTVGAATLGGVIDLSGCGSSSTGSESVPVDSYVLDVGYSERMIAGFRTRTRTFNQSLPGPLMTTRPGHELRILMVNQLPPNDGVPPPPGIDPLNNPHDFNTTNLHVHGLQVTPHIFDPIGTSDPNAPMIMIEPGDSKLYSFRVPKDHPSGLYWYHPHSHGAADVQICDGMAGGIVMRGPIDEVPEIAAARDCQHVARQINPGNVEPSSGERPQHTSSPDTRFENRPTELLCASQVEIDVPLHRPGSTGIAGEEIVETNPEFAVIISVGCGHSHAR